MESSPYKKSVTSYGDEMRSVISLDDVSDNFDEKNVVDDTCSIDSTCPESMPPRMLLNECADITPDMNTPLLVKNIRRYSRTKKA